MHPTSRPRTSRARLPVLVLLCLVMVLGSVSFGPVRDRGQLPEAGAQSSRTVTLSRSSALAGETVTVRWSGYTPGATVSIFQCSLPLVSWTSSCAEPTWTAGVTGADGTGSAEFLVWQFTLQGLGSNPALFCGETGCGVVVTECDTELSPGLFASTPLGVPFGGTNPVGGGDDELEAASVGQATAGDPEPAAGQLRAAAGRSINVQAGQAMEPVLPALADAVLEKDINLDSTVLNSPSALEAYVAGRTDLAFSARPLSAEQTAQLAKAGRPSVMIPVALSPLAVVHNMDVRGVPIQRFRLSVDSAAKLYQGLIVGVESADLRRDNGGCGITTSGRTTDRSLLGYFRTGRAAGNFTFSKWLTTAGKDDAGTPLWPPVQTPPVTAPSEQFPNADVGRSKNNNRDLAEFIQLGSEPGASPQITNDQGRLRLGFVDMSAVVELVEESPAPAKPGLFPIRLVQISNKSGNWVTPTPASVTATIAASRIGPDNVVDVDVAADAPDAYPLVSVVYAVVPKAPSADYEPTTAAAGKDLVTYLLSDEGQEIMTEAGFVALPGALAETADKAVATVSTTSSPAAPTTTAPPPASEEFVLGSSDFYGGGFSGGFDSSDGGFGDGSLDGEIAADGTVEAEEVSDTEEVTGDSTIETSASLLERAAGAPTLVGLLVLGALTLAAGQVLKRWDRRRRRLAEAAA